LYNLLPRYGGQGIPVPEETLIDLESLEQKARAASPGPWVVHADGMEFGSSDRSTNPGIDTADGQVVCWWGTGLCGIPQKPDAEFIASSNPETVLAMVEEIRSLRRALGDMLFAFDDGVGEDWSQSVLDFARQVTPAVEFKP